MGGPWGPGAMSGVALPHSLDCYLPPCICCPPLGMLAWEGHWLPPFQNHAGKIDRLSHQTVPIVMLHPGFLLHGRSSGQELCAQSRLSSKS